MKYNLILSIFILTILMIGIANAEVQSLPTIKRFDSINLIQGCVNSTYSNITRVTYPNMSFALNGEYAMTKAGDDYSYAYSNTKEIGTYLVYGHCDENKLKTLWAYDFEVTSTGNDKDLYIPLIIGVLAIVLLGVGIYQRNEWIGLFSGFLFIIVGIYTMIFGLGSIVGEYTRMVSAILIGLGIVTCFVAVGEMFFSWKNGDEED